MSGREGVKPDSAILLSSLDSESCEDPVVFFEEDEDLVVAVCSERGGAVFRLAITLLRMTL